MTAERYATGSVLAKTRERGLQEALSLGSEIVRTRLGRLADRRRAFVFLSPPLNNSGAPLILLQIVDEFAERHGAESVRVLAPRGPGGSTAPEVPSGVKQERAAEVLNAPLARMQLHLRRDDFVFMNSAAVPPNYLDVVLDSLRSGRLAHAYWYMLEDVEQLAALAPSLLQAERRAEIARLLDGGQLTLLVLSKSVKADYDAFFGTTETRVLPFKSAPAEHEAGPLPAAHYSSLRFFMSGKPTDGRKGHHIVLAAFHEFMRSYHDAKPDRYRPFTLTFVGLTDDYISQQLVSVGSTVLGDRLQTLPVASHDDALATTRDCNAVICCSFHETGPLFVTEGMRCGHVVLRNDAGGMDDQLEDGVNGCWIDSTDIRQFGGVLARLLDKQATTDSQLQLMGRRSQELASRLSIPSYVDALEGETRP